MFAGNYLFDYLDGYGVPFAKYFLENPKLIVIIVLLPISIYFTYKTIHKESSDFLTLKKTISEKLISKLILVDEYNNILKASYAEYSLSENSDVLLRFYANNFIDIKIRNVFANYFKVNSKDSTTVQLNLLNVDDSTSNKKFIKKVFRTKPKELSEVQINLIMELIDLFGYFDSIKLDKNGFNFSIKIDLDEKNWKQIDNFLKGAKSIPVLLKISKMYSKAV